MPPFDLKGMSRDDQDVKGLIRAFMRSISKGKLLNHHPPLNIITLGSLLYKDLMIGECYEPENFRFRGYFSNAIAAD